MKNVCLLLVFALVVVFIGWDFLRENKFHDFDNNNLLLRTGIDNYLAW